MPIGRVLKTMLATAALATASFVAAAQTADK